jgi:hypothetical protein
MGNSRTRTLSHRTGRPLLIAALLAAIAYPLAPAEAVKPLKVSFPVEFTYEITELTDLCGVEVWYGIEGTFKGLVYYDKSGAIVREVNSQPDTWQMLYSPETGESIRNPFATRFHYRYPEGTDPGDRVVIVATGYLEKLPGLPARAGRTVFPNGELISVDDGVPIVDYGEPSSDTPGIYKYDFEEADANVCEHLRG